jgi:hypothetical protein
MYLPKSKYKKLVATKLNALVDPNGVLYEGPYFETFKGESYTGDSPSKNSKPLTEVIGPDQTTNTVGFRTPLEPTVYDYVRRDTKEAKLRETLPVPLYYPKPSPSDYSKGILKRYFAIEKTTGRILEISPEVYASIKAQKPEYYYPKYELETLKWSLRDRSTNRINSSVTKLDPYLKDPSQFVR